MFYIVDCVKTLSSDCDLIRMVSWCHDDFSKYLRDVDAIECNNEYIGKIKLLSLYDAMERMLTDIKFISQPQPIIMNRACLCCKSDVNGVVHICSRVDTSDEKCDIIASLSFEKKFNLATCNEEHVSMTNLSMLDTESKLFLYKVDKKRQDHHHENVVGRGNDITTLKHSALNTLTETMDSFKEKCDIYRPSNDTIRANRVHMCLSRIDKPLKKSNNDKGELKLMNHA